MVLAGPATVATSAATGSDAPVGPLVLRIRGTSRDGQLVRIRSRKCTIGSAPDCTLRLDAYGVGPLHCLILRGRRTTLVRRWGPDTLLNGSTFADAELRPGDRLRVGPVELEVLQTTGVTRSTQAVQTVISRESPEFTQLSRRLQIANRQGRQRARGVLAALRAARREIARLESLHRGAPKAGSAAVGGSETKRPQAQARLDAQKDDLARRVQQHDAATKELQAGRAALEAEVRTLRTDQAAIEKDRKNLDAARAAFQTAQRQWQAQQDAAKSEATALRDQLETAQAEWNARIEALREERESWAREREAEQTNLRRRQQELDARQAQLDAQAKKLDTQAKKVASEAGNNELLKERQLWAKKRESEEADLRRRQKELDALKANLDARFEELDAQQTRIKDVAAGHEADANELQAQRKAFQTEQQQWNATRQQHEQQWRERQAAWQKEQAAWHEARRAGQPVAGGAESSPVSAAGAPIDVQDALGRLGTVSLVPDENESPPPRRESSPASKAPAATGSPSSKARPPSPRGEDDADDSIDAYMARLMERVRSVAGESTSEKPAASEPARPRAVEAAETALPSPEVAAPPKEASGPVDLSPRRSAPENVERLSVMRQLASGAAYTALDQHARKMLRRAIRDKLLIAIVATVCGAGLIAGWSVWGLGNVSYYAGLVCILLAVVWGTHYAVLTGRLILRRSRKNPWAELLDAALAESQPADAVAEPAANEPDPAAAADPVGPAD
ncbi:MAG: hypothetical protein JW809_05175 [Pirellulales bacterium]|nr:hypothetical protein [Pirellulales bacterium]